MTEEYKKYSQHNLRQVLEELRTNMMQHARLVYLIATHPETTDAQKLHVCKPRHDLEETWRSLSTAILFALNVQLTPWRRVAGGAGVISKDYTSRIRDPLNITIETFVNRYRQKRKTSNPIERIIK